MALFFSRLAMGSGLTLSFIFSFVVSSETVWGAPIACTGSASGSAGTCSTIANCNGTAETPASRNSNGGPVSQVCPDDWICCIESSSGGTKPPKDPPIVIDPLPPGGPGQNPGVSCGGGNGTCVNAASECNGSTTPDAACSGVCCLGSVGAPINECTNVGGRCATINGGCTTDETSSTRSCNDAARTCCMPNSNAGGTGNAGASCAGGNGTCSTIANCTGFTPISDPTACTGGLICCPDGGPGNGGNTGGTNTTTGTLDCTGNYQKVAGVCFPKGTGLSEKSVLEIIAALISWLLAIFGFIALLGFIISGVQYLLSTGDEGMAETAKRNMKYSIIGIIVALSGWIIIKAVDALLNASSLI